MAEIKDKLVTVESLAVLNENNVKTYMSKTNPVGDGIMTMNGDTNVSGNVNVGSLTFGNNIKLVAAGDRIEIVFTDEATIEETEQTEEVIEEG